MDGLPVLHCLTLCLCLSIVLPLHAGGQGKEDQRAAAADEQPEMGPSGLPSVSATAWDENLGEGKEKDAKESPDETPAAVAALVGISFFSLHALFQLKGRCVACKQAMI